MNQQIFSTNLPGSLQFEEREKAKWKKFESFSESSELGWIPLESLQI